MKPQPYTKRRQRDTLGLLVTLTASALLLVAIMALTSCAALPPIAVSVQGQHGTYGYSAKRGVEIEIDATK